MKDSAKPVASSYLKAGDLVGNHQRHGQRLERAGWLEGAWRQTENARRARFYSVTRSGEKQLEVETADWSRRAGAIARLLKAEM